MQSQLMERLTIYVLFLYVVLQTSCIPVKKLTYLEENNKVRDSSLSVNLQRRPYRVQVNDVLSIRIKALDQDLVALFNPVANQESAETNLNEGYYYDGFAVDAHGKIRVPTLGEINVLGYTVEEIRKEIEDQLLSDYFTTQANLFVSVKLAGIKYTVAGEVTAPGTQVALSEKLTLMEAIANSGDILITGDRTDIVVIRQYPGGQRVHHVDLTRIEAMQSPYYYLQPNDLVLVNPLPQKSLGTGTTGLSSFTTLLSVIAALSTTVLLFARL